jgi:hypothetical protein
VAAAARKARFAERGREAGGVQAVESRRLHLAKTHLPHLGQGARHVLLEAVPQAVELDAERGGRARLRRERQKAGSARQRLQKPTPRRRLSGWHPSILFEGLMVRSAQYCDARVRRRL